MLCFQNLRFAYNCKNLRNMVLIARVMVANILRDLEKKCYNE